jgi:hypothetical protein
MLGSTVCPFKSTASCESPTSASTSASTPAAVFRGIWQATVRPVTDEGLDGPQRLLRPPQVVNATLVQHGLGL